MKLHLKEGIQSVLFAIVYSTKLFVYNFKTIVVAEYRKRIGSVNQIREIKSVGKHKFVDEMTSAELDVALASIRNTLMIALNELELEENPKHTNKIDLPKKSFINV